MELIMVDLTYAFDSDEWLLELFADGSLEANKSLPDGHIYYERLPNAIDFIDKHGRNLLQLPREHPIHQLASHLNYPICLFEQWLACSQFAAAA